MKVLRAAGVLNSIETRSNVMEFTDTIQLISGCIAGNETAIERLIYQYQNGVFRLALSVLDDPVEANEATQDTFIAALAALEGYRENSSFKAWLYTIALNISRNRLRKRRTIERLNRTLQNIFRVQSQRPPSPEETVIRNEKDAALWAALKSLGEKQRTPIVLRYFHDLSTAEIAEILQINEGTVSSRLHIGRERLRTELEQQSGFSGE
jgi:RNA polymerase sigma-70 factor (ECF subfamily)